MTMSIIRSTFMTALSAYAAAHNPVLTISRENTAFVKPANNATFLEAFLIPANTTLPTLAADTRRFWGDFQVNIWTKDGIGAGTGEVIAEEIAQLFPVVPKNYLPVSVEGPANIRRSLTDTSGWRVTPVLIPYRMESEN